MMLAATAGLMAHHLFGVWNGDRRLRDRHGEAFEAVKARTSPPVARSSPPISISSEDLPDPEGPSNATLLS